MGTEDHGVGFAQLFDQITDLNDLDGVQSHGGFVQDNDPGVPQQSLGDAHPLPVALGQGGDGPAAHLRDPGLLHDSGNLLLQRLPLQALGTAHKAQVLLRRLAEVEGGLFGQVADAPFGLFGRFKHIIPVHLHMTAGGRQAAGHDVHGGGFSRPVGPQKAIYMALVDLKGQIVHRQKIPIAFGQMFHGYHIGPPCRARQQPALVSEPL